MKLKRIFTFCLAMLLLLGNIPAISVSSVESINGPAEAYYSFALPMTYSQITTGYAGLGIEDQKDAIDELYDTGVINWTFEHRENGNAKGNNSGEWREPRANVFYKSNFYTEGYGLYWKDHASTSYNGWYAIRFRAPGVGTYSVTVNSALPPENGGNATGRWLDTYIFDASLLADGSKTIADFLTEEHSTARFAPTLTELDLTLANVAFTSAEQEYILVFHATAAARSANTGTRSEHMALNGLTFTQTDAAADIPKGDEVPEETTTPPTIPTDLPQTGYSFNLLGNYPTLFESGTFSVSEQQDKIHQLFNNGYIDWTYHSSGVLGDDEKTSIYRNEFTKGGGLQAYTAYHDWYYAITFRAPGTGTFDVTINTYLANGTDSDGNPIQKHSCWTEAYVVEAASFTNINDALIRENRVKRFAPTVENPNAYIGNLALTEDVDYVIILRETRGTQSDGNRDGLSTAHLFLKGLSFVEADPQAPVDGGYNFDLVTTYPDDFDAVGDFSVTEQQAQIDALYAGGYLDWRYYGSGILGENNNANIYRHQFLKGSGLQVYTNYHNWYYAVQFRAPASGTHDITLNTYLINATDANGNPIKKHSTWTEAYIVKACELTSIENALTKANRIKRFAPTVDNPDAYIGNVDLVAGEDYVIILRETRELQSEGNKDGLSAAHLFLKGLSFEKADPPTPVDGGYNFDLVGTYPDDFDASGDFSVTEQKDQIDVLYNDGYLDWRYHSSGVLGDDERTTIYRNQFAKGNGLQAYTAYHDWYYAIQFRAPGTGTHNITLNTFLTTVKDADGNYIQKHSVWTEAYIVKASDLKSVKDALTKANKIKRFTPTVDNPDAYIGNVALTEGVDYVIILRETRETRDEGHRDALSTDHLFLKGLSFEKALPPSPVNGGYNFDLITVYPDDFEATGDFSVEDQKALIDTLYKGGYLSWTFLDRGAVGAGTGYVYRNQFTKGKGIQAYGFHNDWWYAIRIKSPGAGPHMVTLNSYLNGSVDKDGNPILKHSMWVNAYIVEASAIDSGKSTIADSILKRNLVGVFAPTVDDPSADIGYYTFEANKEYILILRQSGQTRDDSRADGLSTDNLYLSSLSFTYNANPPKKVVDNSKVVYDFDLGSPKTGVYPNGTKLNEKFEDVSRLYGLDELNWKLEHTVDGTTKFYLGVSTYGVANDYVSFRIKSPGKGLYTLTLNHSKGGRMGTGAVYILPVSAADDIKNAMDIHNRVGRVKFSNEDGNVNPTTGHTTLLGTWEFGADKEYIVVVEAYSVSPYYKDISYMSFASLTCEKGDVTANYPIQKTINSVVINDGPVKTVDTGAAMFAVGEVNGHDYMYVPLEGKKLNIYDLDAKKFIAQVITPFTVCRGICIDDEGIVWAVGDNPYIFRYDPYLNVGEDAYYYKGFDAESDTLRGADKIYGAYAGTDCIYVPDDGCLYFGVAYGGYWARYDTKNNKFTNLGSLGGDSGAWTTAQVYYDGYLLGPAVGDTDGDGKKTALFVKMVAETGEVVKVIDITEHINQGEVMMRGGGICNGVVLIGGDANEKVKKLLAIDAETMEILDLNVRGNMNYGTTEEIDGKVYFNVCGLGLHMFDGKTATKVETSYDFTHAMMCNEDSSATIEGDSNFPGVSLVTYNKATNEPFVFNPQTLKIMSISGLIEESHGTGNQLLSMANNPAETDKLYIGVFNNVNCSIVDLNTGETTFGFESRGQTDSLIYYDNKLFAGCYSTATLLQVNLDDKRRNVVLLSLKSEYEQARVHTLYADDGMVFMGTIPDWYKYGGCLAFVDLETLERTVVRHVVENQNIISVTYHDGIAYAGSAPGGGLGVAEYPGTSAKIALYDVEKKEKIIEIDPRDYISGLPEKLDGVSGLIPDPEADKNGIIWGITGGTVFTIQYDKTTGKVKVEEKLSFDKTQVDNGWVDTPMQIVDGYLYVNMGQKGGVRKINIRNVSDNVQIPIANSTHYLIGGDGNIYYAVVESLRMYPLAISDNDWAVADSIDKMLTSIGAVTLETEQKILEIEAAYNNLTTTQKALVQYYYKLEDAKVDLLECKIDAIGEVTLDDADFINQIKTEYDLLGVKERTYVKNFRTVFVPAMQELQRLFDVEAAAKVQAMIDTIPGMGEITLDKEAAIREIEKAYMALSTEQKALVDATHLENALATIKALRQVRIDRLIELINSLGVITLADEPVINEAMEIYDWLTMDERELVDYVKLSSANAELKKLQKAAAAEVDALIEAIGDSVNYSSGEAIKAARAAYDALTPGSKQFVKLLGILEEAEALYASLFPIWAYIVIAVVGVAAVAAAVTVILVKRKKNSAAEQEDTVTQNQE